MSTNDPFGRTDLLDAPTLDALVERFEARGANQRFSQMLHEYLDAMAIDGARAVLELGCGSGTVARSIVHRPAFSGTVVGIDLSPHLVDAAKRLAAEEGVANRTEFRVGDALSLDAGETYDAVVAHTLFSHVDDAQALLLGAARVLHPGGTLGIFDGDYASLTFGNADPAKAKAYNEAVISAVVANPHVMRQMPRWLRGAGLELAAAFSYVLSEVGTATFWSSAIETYRRLIPKTGALTEQEADEWAAELRRDSDVGVFFASCNYYSYIARRA